MIEWLHLTIFAGIYWLTARVGLLCVLQPEGVASIWPVSGLALATLLWVGDKDRYKYVIALFVANFLANFTDGNTAPASLGFAFANTAEAGMGWWTFNRIAGPPQGFIKVKEVWGIAATAILANGLTALLGAAVPYFAFRAPYWSAWELWWVADGLGMMLITPLLISWAYRQRAVVAPAIPPHPIEGTAIIVLTTLCMLIIFKLLPVDIPILNRPYALFFLVIWMAIRFEAPGVSCLSFLIALPFLGNLLYPLGIYPWQEATRILQLVQTQGYLIILSTIGLVTAASISGIRNNEQLLQSKEEALLESHRLLEEVQSIAKLGGWECDVATRKITWTDEVYRIYGVGRDHDPSDLGKAIGFYAPESAPVIEQAFRRAVELGEPYDLEMEFVRADGNRIWVRTNGRPVIEGGQVVRVTGNIIDITDRKCIEEELRESEIRYRELSIIDDLTQLYNSRHFYHQLRMEIDRVNRYGQPLTLLLLDLDDFKRFNDEYGHVEGDQVLSRLGQVIKRWLRQTDSAYRYGGEEFTILLPMTTSEDGVVTAERIRTEFQKETFTPAAGKEAHMTLSIGLAEYRAQEDMRAFVHRVDQFMYQGKKNGKNRVCTDSAPRENPL